MGVGESEEVSKVGQEGPAPLPNTGPAPRVARLPLAASLKAWLRSTEAEELLIVLSLLALCVLYRVLILQPVEIWGDAGQKWHFVRQWSFANDFSQAKWTHHMARLGANIPTFFVQRLFGTSVTDYYIAPVAIFTLEVLLVYVVGRRLRGRAAGVLAALFLIFFEGANRSSSQLLPDVFEAAAAMLVAYCLVRFYEEEGRKRLYFLIAVGLGFAWEYMIKESAALILPGITAAVWLSKRRFKEVLILGGVVAAYVALETAGFRLFTPMAHRLAVVQSGHGEYPPITFWQLFDRYTTLEASWQMLFWMWASTLLWHFGSRDRRILPLLLMPISFMFFLTFLVKSINPIHQWTAFKSRYIVIAGPFFVLGFTLFTVEAARRVWALHAPPRLLAWPGWIARRGPVCVFGLCLVLGLVTFRSRASLPGLGTLQTVSRDASILNDAYRRNLPIFETNVPLLDGVRYARALSTTYAVYFRAKYLAQSTRAKPGWLPDIQEGVRVTEGKSPLGYLLRDENAYREGEMAKLIRAGCAVEVGTTRSRITMRPKDKLPERCRAPRGDVIPR